MTMSEDLLSFITSRLESELKLSDETYSEYIAQLSLDESIEVEEKKSIITEFLEEATEKDTKDLVNVILTKAEDIIKSSNVKQDVDTADSNKVDVPDLLLEPDAQDTLLAPSKSQKPILSKEERRRRELLLRQYGYEADEVVENEQGEAEILYSGGGSSSADSQKEIGLMKNDNADRVKEAQQQRRSKMQAEHAAKVQRDKDALKKQLEDKEKEKRRTQKKEKRRM